MPQVLTCGGGGGAFLVGRDSEGSLVHNPVRVPQAMTAEFIPQHGVCRRIYLAVMCIRKGRNLLTPEPVEPRAAQNEATGQ